MSIDDEDFAGEAGVLIAAEDDVIAVGTKKEIFVGLVGEVGVGIDVASFDAACREGEDKKESKPTDCGVKAVIEEFVDGIKAAANDSLIMTIWFFVMVRKKLMSDYNNEPKYAKYVADGLPTEQVKIEY